MTRHLWTWWAVPVLLIVLAVTTAGNGQAQSIVLSVNPSEIERGDAFFITVSTGHVNDSVRVVIADEYGRTVQYDNRTDSSGVWSIEVGYPFDFGTYLITAFVLNETGFAIGQTSQVFRVQCGGRCIAETLAVQHAIFGKTLEESLTRAFLVFIALWALIEIPRLAGWLYVAGDRAKREGSLTPREYAMAPFSGIRAFVPSSRQGIHVRANERIAVDMERRQKWDELHRLTGERFWEFNPVQVQAVKAKVAQIDTLTMRQRQLSASVPRVYHEPPRVPVTIMDGGRESDGVPVPMQAGREATASDLKPPAAHPAIPKVITRPTNADMDTLSAIRDFEKEPWGASVALAEYRNRARGRWHRAIVLFLIMGMPAALMLGFIALAYVGVYVDPVRPLWRPWLGDMGKVVLGVVALNVTGYALVRKHAGWRRARIAGA